jgi:hypothetical protein
MRTSLRKKAKIAKEKIGTLSTAFVLAGAIYIHVIYYGYFSLKHDKKERPWL